MGLSKLYRFIKNKEDFDQTRLVIRKHYAHIKNQFINQIAHAKSYPSIDWLDFVGHCNNWKIIDKNLTSADVDRIFVATNYEENDLEDNDDSSLCRFEFAEIIVRMAKTKYYEKGTVSTIAEAVEKLITNYIIPNSCEMMLWQEFREVLLWTLEVDDLFKANKTGIEALSKLFATNGT
jgi:hypothetical protein